jgi:uncharacterized membrane protein YgaE (UPF0421/DUF939 family)
MRVNAAAAIGAGAAALLAIASHAAHPAQAVVSSAAACALLALLTRRKGVASSDWLTVRVLLAGNLVVFGISDIGWLGAASVVVIALGISLLVTTLRAHRHRRRKSAGRH